MRRCLVLLLTLAGGPALSAQAPYKAPPPDVVAILDAPPLPAAVVSPDRTSILLIEQRSMPTVAELARPWLRLAGSRINPRTNGPRQPSLVTGLVLKRVADGVERRIAAPASGIGFAGWSPDGRRIAFTVTGDSMIGLWIVDAATAQARRLPVPPLNAADGPPCQWMPDGARLLCLFVPGGRGAPPPEPAVPVGPTTQETSGRPAPVRTYEDLLENSHDETLFDYYFTGQLALVDAASGAVTNVGSPAVIDRADPAPGVGFILVVKTVRPYSFLVPADLFPKSIEIWTVQGERVRTLAELPLADNIPARGVRAGPRAITWQPSVPATLVWAEAQDGGDPRTRVAHQDRVLRLTAPFTDAPGVLAQIDKRYAGITWDTAGFALLNEFDRDRRWAKTWLLDPHATSGAPALLWDRSAEDRYADPGTPLQRGVGAQRSLLRSGDWIYLAGAGASPQGERPFLDRLNLKTRRTERLWRADTVHYEAVVAVLDDAAR